jgi:hypothetical protein
MSCHERGSIPPRLTKKCAIPRPLQDRHTHRSVGQLWERRTKESSYMWGWQFNLCRVPWVPRCSGTRSRRPAARVTCQPRPRVIERQLCTRSKQSKNLSILHNFRIPFFQGLQLGVGWINSRNLKQLQALGWARRDGMCPRPAGTQGKVPILPANMITHSSGGSMLRRK